MTPIESKMPTPLRPAPEKAATASRIVIDDIDRNIIAVLHQDPRATNKAVAKAVAISEATVANRIRRMVAANALKFTLQRNAEMQGFSFNVIAYLTVSGRSATETARDIGKIEQIYTVILAEGSADVVAFVNCRNHGDAYDIVYEKIAKVEGVKQVAFDITLRILKDDCNYAMISD